MLSYQSVTLRGFIQTMSYSPYQGWLASLQIEGFEGLLTIPIDQPGQHEIGDVIEVVIKIDRIICKPLQTFSEKQYYANL